MGVKYFTVKADFSQRIFIMVFKSDVKSGRSFHELINKEPYTHF